MQMKDFFILVLIPRVYGSLPPRPAPPAVALASLNGWSLSQNGAKLHNKSKKYKGKYLLPYIFPFFKEKTKNICAQYLGAKYHPDTKGYHSRSDTDNVTQPNNNIIIVLTQPDEVVSSGV